MTINATLLLAAIAAVETGSHGAKDFAAVGREHERSRYQISEAVWREHTDKPFELASTPEGQAEAERVAETHIVALYRRLEREAGLLPSEITVDMLAYGWNSGGGAMVDRARRAKKDGKAFRATEYVKRVRALYDDAAEQQSGAAIPAHLR